MMKNFSLIAATRPVFLAALLLCGSFQGLAAEASRCSAMLSGSAPMEGQFLESALSLAGTEESRPPLSNAALEVDRLTSDMARSSIEPITSDRLQSPALGTPSSIPAIDTELSQASKFHGLQLLQSSITSSHETWPVTIGKSQTGEVYFVSIGPVRIISRTLIPQSAIRLGENDLVVWLEGSIGYSRQLIPAVAAMLKVRSRINGAVVEDDGIGRGVLGLLALRMGASKVIGIEMEKAEINSAYRSLTFMNSHVSTPYEGGMISEGWKTYSGTGEHQFLLIHANLNEWFDLPVMEREKITGAKTAIRISLFGPIYGAIQARLVDDTLSQEAILGILAGFVEPATIHFRIQNTIEKIMNAGWRTEIFRADLPSILDSTITEKLYAIIMRPKKTSANAVETNSPNRKGSNQNPATSA